MDSSEKTSEKERNTQDQAVFTLQGSKENVYGEYMHMTFAKENRLKWSFVIAILLVVSVWCLFMITHPELFTKETFGTMREGGAPLTPTRIVGSRIGVPLAWFFLSIFIVIVAYFIFSMKREGWSYQKSLLARISKWLYSKDKRPQFKYDENFYFNSFERFPVSMKVFDDRIVASGGKKDRTVKYSSVEMMSASDELLVLRTSWRSKRWDIIADISQLSDQGESLIHFLEEKVPSGCKQYLKRSKREN